MTPTSHANTSIDTMLRGYRLTQLLHVVATLGIADHLVEAPRTARDLAARVGADPDVLYRVLRALAAEGIFFEDDRRTFALTDDGHRLRSDVDDSVRPVAIAY